MTERIVWKERNLIFHHGVHRSTASKFCKAASNICGSSVWNSLHHSDAWNFKLIPRF